METCTISIKSSGDEATVTISGFINEGCELFKTDFSKYSKVTIDFENTTFINSLGIRMWMDWLRSDKVLGQTKLILINCVPSLVAQFNMIKGFLTENCEVQSLYADYYFEDSSEEHRVLLTRGEEFLPETNGQPGWVKIAEEIETDKGEELILDTIKEKYFAFLGQVKFQEP